MEAIDIIEKRGLKPLFERQTVYRQPRAFLNSLGTYRFKKVLANVLQENIELTNEERAGIKHELLVNRAVYELLGLFKGLYAYIDEENEQRGY